MIPPRHARAAHGPGRTRPPTDAPGEPTSLAPGATRGRRPWDRHSRPSSAAEAFTPGPRRSCARTPPRRRRVAQVGRFPDPPDSQAPAARHPRSVWKPGILRVRTAAVSGRFPGFQIPSFPRCSPSAAVGRRRGRAVIGVSITPPSSSNIKFEPQGSPANFMARRSQLLPEYSRTTATARPA